MSKFIKVLEKRYGSWILLNLEHVVSIDLNTGAVLTSGVHGEQNGFYEFSENELSRIIKAIGKVL